MLKELRALETVLLAPPALQQTTMNPVNPALHALIKEADGKRWLIMANDSRRAEATTLALTGSANDEAKPLIDGIPPLTIRDSKASIQMPPLGVAVYELPSPAKDKP